VSGYRISADLGQLVGAAGAGALIGAVGAPEALVMAGAGLLLAAGLAVAVGDTRDIAGVDSRLTPRPAEVAAHARGPGRSR
jgi:hypothetical protein